MKICKINLVITINSITFTPVRKQWSDLLKLNEMKFNIVKGNEVVGTVNYSDLKSDSKVVFESSKLLSNNNGKHRFFTPKEPGSYTFGGTYIDISSNKLLVDIYGVDMMPYYDYDLSKEK